MKRKTIGIGIGALFGVLLLVLGGIWYYIQTSAFMDKVESTAPLWPVRRSVCRSPSAPSR